MRFRMAPRMIQSMEILQLPLMALQERIDQELSENMALVDDRRDPEAAESPDEAHSGDRGGFRPGRHRADRGRLA